MNFFRCRACGITQAEVNISDAKLTELLSDCPACGFDHFAEGYAMHPEDDPEEEVNRFANGDAVVARDGHIQINGVVSEVYDDVVEVDYFDGDSGTFESMEFHVSHVEALI